MSFAFDKLARWLLILALVLIGLSWPGPIAINAAFDLQATREEVARIVRKHTGREHTAL